MKTHVPTVSVVFATFHGAQFVEGWSNSLQMQTYPIHEIIVVDNSLNDATASAIQKIANLPVQLFRQEKNLDFAQGYSLGMSKATGEYICILNQDIVLDAHAIEELVRYMSAHPKVGAVSPALLRFGSDTQKPIIDSLGININRARRFRNIGEGESCALPRDPFEVFALTGAAICFRREALDCLRAVHGEYFDPLFVSYKEDIDISYRLHHIGYQLVVVPSSIMYHKRTAQEQAHLSLHEQRKQKSFRIRGNSLKNQWWVLIKNERWSTLIIDAPWILVSECAKLIYILFMEPSTLRIMKRACMELPLILSKRKMILRASQYSNTQLRTWILKNR